MWSAIPSRIKTTSSTPFYCALLQCAPLHGNSRRGVVNRPAPAAVVKAAAIDARPPTQKAHRFRINPVAHGRDRFFGVEKKGQFIRNERFAPIENVERASLWWAPVKEVARSARGAVRIDRRQLIAPCRQRRRLFSIFAVRRAESAPRPIDSVDSNGAASSPSARRRFSPPQASKRFNFVQNDFQNFKFNANSKLRVNQ